ncbi:hypothetical protein [Halalkalibaculum sp. DA384]|uniref:hypothetical protein n=1 Tax=Halalkalibaculum sp. DA384 TaxID=3373606 RepID=UPI0037541B73
MDKQVFRISNLDIQKMPGLPRGLKAYEGLSPQINIIAGPNASGKSSTARAIQRIIWQHDTKGLKVEADAKIDDDNWKVRIDSNDILVQREGKNERFTGIPAAEARSRYMLALHKLIEAEEGDLARKIIKESIGGYDLEEAASALDYSDHIKTNRSSEYRSYEEANEEVRKTTKDQNEIKNKEAQLADLYKKKEDAEKAEKRKQLYERIKSFLEARQDYGQIKAEYEEFPEVLESVHGEELERIKGIEEEIHDAKQTIQKAKEERQEYQEQIEELDIPKEGVDSEDLTELEERVDQVKELEKKITDLDADIEKTREAKDDTLKSLGDQVDAENFDKLSLRDIENLDQFLQEAHQTASTQSFLEKEINELENELKDVPDKSLLQKGIDILTQWLKEPRSSIPTFPLWVFKLIAAITLLGGIGLFFSWVAGLIALSIILILVLVGLFKSSSAEENESVRIRKQDYGKTGLNPPENWESDEVQDRLAELVNELQGASWQERVDREIDKRRSQLKDLGNKIEDVEESAENLKKSLSALPKLPFNDPQNYTALYWFITHVKEWQRADTELVALEKKRDQQKAKLEEEIQKCNELLTRYNFASVGDSAEALAKFKNLRDQEGSRQSAEKEIANKKDTIEEKEELKEHKTQDLQQVYDKLKIPVGQKAEVQKLLGQKDNFETVKEEYNVSKSRLSEKRQDMKEHSWYEREQLDIDEISTDQAKDKLEELKAEAGKLDGIKENITQIETEVNNVKAGNNLELALKRRDEALENLYQLYESNVSSVAGKLLVDQLKSKIKKQNRPPVFQRAKELFNRITKGKYEIDTDDRDQPEFIAYDTEENLGKKLDELSTGTRIQLLLSIRVAFVETQESNIKLPLLADELLANSDDDRAKAIIEALTEISKEGRQIFYFTAQADEVAKWHTYLSEVDGVEFELYGLEEGVNETDWDSYKELDVESLSLLKDIPKPNGETYEEYSDKVDVAKFDLLKDQPTQLHLWYLFDDKDLLYQCLNKGFNTWGSLKSFINHGGVIEDLNDEVIARLESKVQVLERFQELYQQGRPKPIDRSILESTSAVSDNFINEVSKKLSELNGNPAKLLTSLLDGEISGFRTNKIEELENYLIEKGFIDDRDPLDLDEIRARLQAYVSNLDMTSFDADEFLNRLLTN